MGRQSALSSDLVVNYDPLSGSNAWSVITYEGASGGGGVTEDRIYDNSYEYRVNIGPVRLAAEAQLQNGGNSSTGNAFEGNIGADYMGFSVDVVGGKIFDSLSIATTLSAAQQAALATAPFGCSLGCVSGTISDNTFFQIAARYTIGPWKLYGGYEHIDYANPNNALAPGAFAQGGYNISNVNNTNFTTDKILQVFWAGVKYAITPTLDITGAYYGERQNSFVNASNPFGNCTTAIASSCSGALDAASLVVDWRFARHVDLYAGVMYSQKTNGLANGYVLTATNASIASTFNTLNKVSAFDPGVGLRYQF
jgi:predicted porin